MKVFILFILFALALFSNINCGSNKDEYVAQDLCGKAAHAAFQREYGNQISLTEGIDASYTCHYNKKLKKCFMLVDYFNAKGYGNFGPFRLKKLSDVNENKEYGRFVIWTKDNEIQYCRVLEKECSSESEWDALVKPYMEE